MECRSLSKQTDNGQACAIFLPLEQMEEGGTFRHTALGSVPTFILAGVILGSGGSWWPLSVCSSIKLCPSRCHHLNKNLTNFFLN